MYGIQIQESSQCALFLYHVTLKKSHSAFSRERVVQGRFIGKRLILQFVGNIQFCCKLSRLSYLWFMYLYTLYSKIVTKC